MVVDVAHCGLVLAAEIRRPWDHVKVAMNSRIAVACPFVSRFVSLNQQVHCYRSDNLR